MTEMAYATGPVSDVTSVVSGPSHGRLVPVSAAKAPLVANCHHEREHQGYPKGPWPLRNENTHTIHLISSSALRHIVMRRTFVLRDLRKALPQQLRAKALTLASEDSDRPGIQ